MKVPSKPRPGEQNHAGKQKAPAQPHASQQNPVPSNVNPYQLQDRQIISVINAFDVPLYITWYKQLSKNMLTFLTSLEAFAVARPRETTSVCPYSQFLRVAWRHFVHGNYDECPDDLMATGMCCAACLQRCGRDTPDFIQFVDFNNQEEIVNALMKLYWHMKRCPYAHQRGTILKNHSFSIENDTDALALRAFTEWFSDCMIEGDAIEHGLPVSAPSARQRQLAVNAIAKYRSFEEASIATFRNMEDALFDISHRRKRANGILASDLTEVPTEDPLPEYPFYLLLQEHIEIVRVKEENASQHNMLLKKNGADSLVLFQCRCCHGKSLVNDGFTPSKMSRSYVLYQPDPSFRTHFVCEITELAFHHLQECPEVSPKNKQRLRRVAPDPKTSEFDRFAIFLQARIQEWADYIKTELDFVKTAESVAPCKDVPLWQPVNDLIEGSDSIWSTMPPTPTRPPPRVRDLDDNDVLEGFDGACEYVGNRRFRKIVAGLRDEFLSTSDSQERMNIANKVLSKIHVEGGLFRRLDADGVWREMARLEAMSRATTALEKGFASLLLPYPSSRRRGFGANVLETEVAPRYDILSDRKRNSIATTIPADNSKRHCLGEGPSVRAVADL